MPPAPPPPPPPAPELPPGLVAEYLESARAQLGVLAGLAKRLIAAGGDRDALEALRRETHKIHGSAGSYGFMDASRLAAGMEATVKDWVARPDDKDVDRGSLAGWFVKRLAEMLGVDVPAAAALPSLPRVGSPPRPAPKSPVTTARQPAAPPAAAAPPSPRPAPRSAPPPAPRPTMPGRERPVQPPERVVPVSPPKPAESVPKGPTPGPTKSPLRPPAPPSPARPAASPAPVPRPSSPVAAPDDLTWIVPPPPVPPAQAPRPATPPKPEALPTQAQPPAPPATPTPKPVAPPPVARPVVADDAAQVPEVIYVEDDAALAELLEYGLRAHGYRFLAYRNGRDALRELLALDVRGTRPLLLLDVDLPALDGYSILGALERERPGIYRVVFTTVHGTEEEQLRGLEAGALDYLVKPISLRVALEKIKRWVGR